MGHVLVIFSGSHRIHRSSLHSFVTSKRSSLRKLFEDHHDTKRELTRLKQLCDKNQIDPFTRKQKEKTREQFVSKGGKTVNKSTVT